MIRRPAELVVLFEQPRWLRMSAVGLTQLEVSESQQGIQPA